MAILHEEDLNPQEYTKGDSNAEIKWVQIKPVPNVHHLIGGCYRTEKEEKKIIQEINKSIYSKDATNILLFGDFNFRIIQWGTLTTTIEFEKAFVDTLIDDLLTQVVDEPTRGNNTLDLIISGSPTDIEKWVLCPPFSTSDHLSLESTLKCHVPRIHSEPRKVHLYSKANYSDLNDEIESNVWPNLLKYKSIDDIQAVSKEVYYGHVDKHVHHKIIRPNSRLKPPWTKYKSVDKATTDKRKA